MATSTSNTKTSSSAKKAGAPNAKDTLDWRIKELRAFDVSRIQDRWDPVLESLHKSVNTVLAEVLGSNSPDYRKFAIETFDATLTLDFSGRYSTEELQRSVQDNIAQAIVTLDRVKALLRERSRQQPATPAPAAEPPPAPAAPAAPVVVPAPAAVAPPVVRPAPPAPVPAATPAPVAPTPVASVAPTQTPAATMAAPAVSTPTPAPVPAPLAAPAPVVAAPPPALPPATASAPVVVAVAQTPSSSSAAAPTVSAAAAPAAQAVPTGQPQPAATSPATVRVAVIGGHNAPARQATLDFIQQLGLQTANRQPGEGLYLDRLEGLRDLHYAVVLLPASALDLASGQPKAAPPELLMELGFVLGKLGRSRVCFLVSGEANIPAWQGIVNLRMDDDGLWHLLLARAMKQAGLDVDLNRAV